MTTKQFVDAAVCPVNMENMIPNSIPDMAYNGYFATVPSGGIYDLTTKKYKSAALPLEKNPAGHSSVHRFVFPASAHGSLEHLLRAADPGYPDGYRQFGPCKKSAAGRSEYPGQPEHVQGGGDTDADYGRKGGVLQPPGQRRRQLDGGDAIHCGSGAV